MDLCNGFACNYDNSFDYGYNYSFDYSFGFSFDFYYAYGNRKGPHKQSLIVKLFFHFQNSNIFHFLKVTMDILK